MTRPTELSNSSSCPDESRISFFFTRASATSHVSLEIHLNRKDDGKINNEIYESCADFWVEYETLCFLSGGKRQKAEAPGMKKKTHILCIFDANRSQDQHFITGSRF